MKIVPIEDVPEYLIKLFEYQVEALTKKGFVYKFCFSRKKDYVGSSRENFFIVYYQEESCTFATIGLSPLSQKHLDPVDVVFSTDLVDGRKVVTHRYSKELYNIVPKNWILSDSLFADFILSLNFHLAKVKEINVAAVKRNFDEAEREKLVEEIRQQYSDSLSGITIETADGGYRLKFIPALKAIIRFRRLNKKYSKILKQLKAKKTIHQLPIELRINEHRFVQEVLSMFDKNYNAKVIVFFVSLFVFMLSFSFIIPNLKHLTIFTLFLLMHEFGHAIMMKKYGCKNLQVMFLPFLGAIAQASNRNVSSPKQLIILFAGPLPGIILGLIIYGLDYYYQLKIDPMVYGYVFILNYFNLLPIYPLDGGQILDIIFFTRNYLLKIIFQFVSLILCLFVCYYLKSFTLLIVAYFICLKIYNDIKLYQVIKELKAVEGLNTLEEDGQLRTVISSLEKNKIKYTDGKLHYLLGILSEKKCPISFSILFFLLYLLSWVPAGLFTYLYYLGRVTPSKHDATYYFEKYTKCAAEGNTECHFDLARCYQFGTGVEKNIQQAVMNYELAAKDNYGMANIVLANIYREGKDGITKDVAKAIGYLEKAFENGAYYAATELGEIYQLGDENIPVDKDKSIFWYKKGAEKGNGYAQQGLASLYYSTKNYEEAFYWYLMSYKYIEADDGYIDTDALEPIMDEIKAHISPDKQKVIQDKVKEETKHLSVPNSEVE